MVTEKQVQHTPGPFRVQLWQEGQGKSGHRILDADGIEIASLSYTSGPEDADARLFAAAPELLAIVERIVEFFGDTNSPLGNAAREAIAKARGDAS